MKNILTYLRIAFLSVFAICLIALLSSISKGVESDVFSILNSHDSSLLSALTKNSTSTMNILCEGSDKSRVLALAKKYNLKKGPSPSLKDTLRVISNHKDGLLAQDIITKIKNGETKEIKDEAIAQLFGFSPNLFSVKEDPFFLATSYIVNLQSNNSSGWEIEDGVLINNNGTNHFALVSLDKSLAEPLKTLQEIRNDNASQTDVKIWAGGAPFHAAISEASAKKEINILSGLSIAICLTLGIVLLRTLKFIPFLTIALGISSIIATSFVFIFFQKPHILSLVFGTSLIGLSVDYTYHAFSVARNKNIPNVQRALAKPLTCALITTCTCFSPLFFASIEILQQMASFTVAGLVSMYCCVMLSGRIISINSTIEESTYHQFPFPFFLKIVLITVFIVSSFGILKLKTGNDLSKIYIPQEFLAKSEKRILECGHAAASSFCVIKASSVQEALETEESHNIKGLSSIIPSLKKQRENARLIRKLYEEEAESFSKSTGIKIEFPDEGNLRFLEIEHLKNTFAADLIKRALIKTDKAVYLISPYHPSTPNACGIQVVEPRKILTELFDACAKETFKLLCFSFTVLLFFLAAVFKKKLFSYLLPSVFASLATAGILGYLNETINFFHVLCFFIFIGLGLDYTIFHLSNPSRQMKKTVFFSFLTSLTGLGMLAFTSFSVTRSMGITLSIGLFFAYIFSNVPTPVRKEAVSSSPWYKQKEQSAGKIRLLIMWYIYKLLGKNIMKLVCIPVMIFIYPFARPAKAAIRKYRQTLNDFSKDKYPSSFLSTFKHLLGFALSMADKTDACTIAKNLPKMKFTQTEDSKEFSELIDSGKGLMVISSHIGTIEVFPAARGLTKRDPHVHAFKQLGHNAIYTNILSSYMDASKLTVHPVEDIGVETASIMKDNIANGDIVIMAGDRISATNPNAVLKEKLLNCECLFPKGVFVFAKLMEAPIFFITCVSTSWNTYEIHVSKHKGELKPKDILASYAKFLQSEILAHPLQWFHFHDFFKSSS